MKRHSATAQKTDLLSPGLKISSPTKQLQGITLPVLHVEVHINSKVLWAATLCISEGAEFTFTACISLFIADLLFGPEHVPPKRRTFNELHGITT
jgi:hypothetical protein